MISRLARTIGLFAVLAPVAAHAQTNLDQGKSAAQIFAVDCAECHKAAHGLGKGKNSAALTDFLREHYTTSREQAAALAAYVLGGRASEPVSATQGRSTKQAPEPANASAEGSAPTNRQVRQPDKRQKSTAAAGKLQRPAEAAAKPQDAAAPSRIPSIMAPVPDVGQQKEHSAATAARNHRKEPKPPSAPEEPAAAAPMPGASAAEPGPTESPNPEASSAPIVAAPTEAAPAEAASDESGEAAPVRRDDIPD